MSLLDLMICLYVKAVVAESSSQVSGLKKNPSEYFPQFTGRVNLWYGDISLTKQHNII